MKSKVNLNTKQTIAKLMLEFKPVMRTLEEYEYLWLREQIHICAEEFNTYEEALLEVEDKYDQMFDNTLMEA